MAWNATREPARAGRPWGPVVDDLEGRTLLTSFVSGVEHRTTQLDITVVNPASTPAPTSGYTATINWGDGGTSVGTVASFTLPGDNRLLEITGQHVYARPGSFSVHSPVKLNGKPLTNVDSLASIEMEPSDDFDFVGSSEATVFRPSTGQWFIRNPNGSQRVISFGAPNLFDIPVPGDYSGTGVTEPAVFRPSTGQWFIRNPNGSQRVVRFGARNLFDIPVPGDYDGVGRTELAVFRPSTAQWFILKPDGSQRVVRFGAQHLFDIPVPGNYDNAYRTEVAVFRPSTAQWFILSPNGVQRVVNFGAQDLFDLPVPGDYFHDGITEPAVFRPSTGQWITANRGFAYGARNLFDLPVETSIASLVALGKVRPHR